MQIVLYCNITVEGNIGLSSTNIQPSPLEVINDYRDI